MTVDLAALVRTIDPTNTVLLFGAGASVPSGAPTGAQLADCLRTQFGIADESFSLSELASLVEQKASRSQLVQIVRQRLRGVRPTGGLLNIPHYPWKSIFTTNYDDLIEQCFAKAKKSLTVFSSNFDFTLHADATATKLFKLHGTIEKDICDGHQGRLILSQADYDQTSEYREQLFDRLRADLAGSNLLIIGYSLQDPEIQQIVSRATELAVRALGASKISLVMYQKDDDRARLLEARGLRVSFGGIDSFIQELHKHSDPPKADVSESDPLGVAPALRPTTIDVDHAVSLASNVSAMFNGWPASYADVAEGLTFERVITDDIEEFVRRPESLAVVILGASGVGKTTAARQAVIRLRQHGYIAWEHHGDYTLNVNGWLAVAGQIKASSGQSVLVVDEAHSHLQEINELIEGLAATDTRSLRLILISTRHNWYPRVKTPNLYRYGKEIRLSKLRPTEVDRLIALVEGSNAISSLVEDTFAGFSRHEKRRRLVDRCEAETFVCLKSIFASEKFDDIILREYASLPANSQDIYRHVAAMQSAGIRVHRQQVVRLLGIPATDVRGVLDSLRDIVSEYTISEREGLYGWRGRHSVIVSIISKYKYPDIEKRVALFSRVIESISPTYEIEVRSIRELCNLESGIAGIPDKNVQNRLLRRMMSVVPGERVPRHRLIRNLIDLCEFEKAETEMRIFEKDFGRDGPVARYKVALLTERARHTPGILDEDRVAILSQASGLAANAAKQYPNNKFLLRAYCEVGIELYRRTGKYDVYDAALRELKLAEERIGDPDISRMVAQTEARLKGQEVVESEECESEVGDSGQGDAIVDVAKPGAGAYVTS